MASPNKAPAVVIVGQNEKRAPSVAARVKMTTEQFLDLYFLNIDKIHAFYKAEPLAGQTVGYNTQCEMIFANLAMAREYAARGQIWEPL